MKNILARFVKDESGATAIEYGLIAAVISLVVATAGQPVNAALSGIFQRIANDLSSAL